ncbi:MAG: UTP--glucose-1-phosphate uridylyltransferase GalU [Proteobacteria bacterium]|nr:UTP--glucose-1-phosphate uridylyltransferase GalU [Pseudomonadota bacterium]MDA0976754.1 UTP--glucose-1-phosphate uridylyltransferase GalU [Pseudomonadota bacterium]MDA1037947.1 UTP--glucose-1-phosphate uridylyltransferase GalU [Pseudomonadota bacterium]
MKIIKKAILPVAGFGTRFLPATKAIPKEMLPIIDKTLIEYAVEEAVDAGIEEIIFITSHTKIAIENHFDTNFELEEKLIQNNKNDFIELINPKKFKNIRFTYVRQKSQKGLGDAISHASHLIKDESFAVILADDLIFSEESCLQQLIKIHRNTKTSVIGVNEVELDDISKYGVIDPIFEDDKITIKNIIEKPKTSDAPSNLAVIGRYILDNNIFKYLDKIKEDASNQIQLTDAIKLMLEDYQIAACKYKGIKFDCGSKKGFVAATVYKGLNDKVIKKTINELMKKN